MLYFTFILNEYIFILLSSLVDCIHGINTSIMNRNHLYYVQHSMRLTYLLVRYHNDLRIRLSVTDDCHPGLLITKFGVKGISLVNERSYLH